MNKATEIAQRILDEQGYIVMAFTAGENPLPKVGDVLFDDLAADRYGYVHGPFVVKGLADADDFVSQSVRFYHQTDESARRFAEYALGFFRLVAE